MSHPHSLPAPRRGRWPAAAARILAPALPLLVAGLLAACGGGGGGAQPPSAGYLDGNHYSTAPLATMGTANETAAHMSGTSTLGGATIAWTATAGHLTASNATTGQAEATFFHVDYTADGADPATRPVTFFFNGGPGSASAWLHLGSFAPKRLATGVPDNTYPRDFPYVDNSESLIDTTDMVFVDAVGTGLSEAVPPFTNNSFWGVDVDAAVMRDFILRWRTANHRESSPLYVFGESYGTVRGPLVVKDLETSGVKVAGLVLQSSILDYNSNCGVSATLVTTVPCTGFIPSYAAVGDWLGLVQPAPADLTSFIDGVASFADTTYDPAARTWLASRTLPDASVIDTLVADTGLPAADWQRQFNMDSDTFRHEIVPGSVAGLYDGRIVATVGSPLDANDEPSDTLITAPFTSEIATVLGDIGYTNPTPYTMLGNAIDGWDFSHAGNALPDVVPDLAAALTLDPALRVLSLNGIHDLITPWHQTALDLARLSADEAARVAFRRAPGGHMTYLDDAGRVAEKADLAAFYAGTLPLTMHAAVAGGTAAPAAAQVRAQAAAAKAKTMATATATGAGPASPPGAWSGALAHRDPGLPPLAARLQVRTTPGASGAALDAQVTAWLRAHVAEIDAARRSGLGADAWIAQLRAADRRAAQQARDVAAGEAGR